MLREISLRLQINNYELQIKYGRPFQLQINNYELQIKYELQIYDYELKIKKTYSLLGINNNKIEEKTENY